MVAFSKHRIVDWSYDAMSRITSEVNALGTFGYNYVDNVSGSSKGVLRLDSIDYPNSQKTKFSWYGNTGDQRLKQISNLAPNGSTLSQFNYGYNPAGEIKQWGQLQGKTSQIYGLDYDDAGQLTGARSGSGNSTAPYLNQNYYAYDSASNRSSVQTTCAQNVRVGGTATATDVLTITVKDPALGGGQEVVNYTVQSSETPTTIAANFAAAITANANLQTLGVNAVSSGSTIILKSASSNLTSYSTSLSGGATETLTLGVSSNFVEQAVIGGTKTTGDVLTLKFFDAALPSGTKSVAYTVLSGDNLTSIATNITSAINADTDLQSAGVTATSVGTAITIKSASANPTTYDYSLSTSATETISLGINFNNPVAAAITGTKTTGDTVTLTVYDSGLPGGSKAKTYTVQSSDNLAAIATGLVALVNGDSDLQAIAVSATSSGVKITLNSNSVNSTAYRASASSGATENLSLGIYPNATQTAAIGGTKTTSDVITISVFDEGLTGGKKDISYTVLSGDNLTSIALGIASALNADTDLQGIGVSATAVSTVVNIASSSVNATTYSLSLSAGATETVTLGTSTGLQQASFNNTNALTKLFSGGAARFEGSTNKAVKSASIATSVLTSKKTETLYSSSTASANTTAPTVTLTNGINTNGTQTVTVGGTVTAGNVVYVTTTNSALPGGSKTSSYTVATGNTINNIATNLASAISSDTDLAKIGVSASASSAVITITSAATTFSSSLSGGATETVTYGTNVNGNVAVSLGGKTTNGDTVSLIVTNSALSGGSETIGYTVSSGNTLADVAAGLVSAWNANTELQSLGLTASNSAAAQLAWSQSFSGNGQLAAGMNTAAISAVDGGNNTKTNLMQVSANAPSTTSLTFDANGNLTSDGVNSFAWDAENRLVKITYPGSNNYSTFSVDPLSRNVKIVETASGSETDTKQFVWVGGLRCELRDGSGTLTSKLFTKGESGSGFDYLYTFDHIGSVREMTSISGGTIQAQYSFDPYGRERKVQGTTDSTCRYAGYYAHSRSELALTLFRNYQSQISRWMSRDPVGETQGVNLYRYVRGQPILWSDPMGLGEKITDLVDFLPPLTKTQCFRMCDVLFGGPGFENLVVRTECYLDCEDRFPPDPPPQPDPNEWTNPKYEPGKCPVAPAGNARTQTATCTPAKATPQPKPSSVSKPEVSSAPQPAHVQNHGLKDLLDWLPTFKPSKAIPKFEWPTIPGTKIPIIIIPNPWIPIPI